MARPTSDTNKVASDRAHSSSVRDVRSTAQGDSTISRRLRLLISALVAYHLLAVFIGAWIGSPPTSPFADVVARPFRTYIAAADLNHGYRFFAPNPGPSHLFRYRLTHDDGSISDGYFPNRSEHWPRLLYHRYFMLSENLNLVRPSAPLGDSGGALSEESLRGYRALADSYAAELLRRSGAARIDWEFVRHYQPPPDDVLAGRSLTDADFYETLERGSFELTTHEELP
jgi:hypothetical protein